MSDSFCSKNNQAVYLGNASNLTHESLYDNFNNIFFSNVFSKRNALFNFPPKEDIQIQKC